MMFLTSPEVRFGFPPKVAITALVVPELASMPSITARLILPRILVSSACEASFFSTELTAADVRNEEALL